MKLKALLLGIIAISLFACDDSWDSVGMGILPDGDEINTYSDTIYIDAVTVKLDSIYAKTIYGSLGQFYDPIYGSLKSGYISQFYSPETDVFLDTVIDNRIDSVMLRIYYTGWVGDSLAPMEVSVYPVIKSLQKHYYTNQDPASYCDMNTLWGKKSYTARDLTISDSAYAANVAASNGIKGSVKVKVPLEIGYRLWNEYKKPAPNAYSSLESFTDFFKGVYVSSSFGTGNMLYIGYTNLEIYYKSHLTGKDVSGNDSIYEANVYTVFNVTKEVIQLNDFRSAYDDDLLRPNDEKTFIKSPAGIFTKVIIPIPDIKEKMGKRKFNNVNLSLTAHEKDSWQYSLSQPSDLLLINPDSVQKFFENQLVYNNVTSFNATRSSNVYNFGNISNVIQDAIDKEPEKNLELLLIPVTYATYYSQYYGTQPYSTANLLTPSGVTLKKGEKYLKLKILTSDMNVNSGK